jgi:hypothetical protein
MFVLSAALVSPRKIASAKKSASEVFANLASALRLVNRVASSRLLVSGHCVGTRNSPSI